MRKDHFVVMANFEGAHPISMIVLSLLWIVAFVMENKIEISQVQFCVYLIVFVVSYAGTDVER